METFTYLGLNVKQLSGFISIDQNSYIDKLEKVDISKER